MSKNNNITIGTGKFNKYTTPWQHDVGVFETPKGKWIVRIKKGKNKKPSTISQHESKENAMSEYENLTNPIREPLRIV